jgi:hypothetical protein
MNNFVKYLVYCVVSLVLAAFVFVSCISEEDYIRDKSANLKFSSDTLRFDTIFTSMGSVTKQIMVYNKENKPIKIDQIRLGGGRNSFYRINVDGDTNIIIKDVEIGAKDSMYIFARVTINPNNQNNPLLVSDSIIFSFNNKEQYVQLEAFGQDAYYHYPKAGNFISIAHQEGAQNGVTVNGYDIQWNNDKPHVVFGVLGVDSLYTLNITSGTRIHFNSKASFLIYRDASLNVIGNTQDPVVFEAIRRDGYYASLPGQWDYIHYYPGSKNNVLHDAIIKNATIGLIIDSCVTADVDIPTVDIKNVRIENMSAYGILSRGGHIKAGNLLVQNTAKETLALTIGGKYQFVYCTFANYWNYESRKTKTVFLQNYYVDFNNNIQLRPIIECNFYNTIIYGSQDEEIIIDKMEGADLNYAFESSLLKTSILNNQSPFVSNCVFNQDPLFNKPMEGDLRIQEGSVAIGMANLSWYPFFPYDLAGNDRLSYRTIGALEYAIIPLRKRN